MNLSERIWCSESDRRLLFDDILLVLDIAECARRNGLPSLEGDLKDIESPLLRTGIKLIVNGNYPDTIEKVLDGFFIQENFCGLDFLRKWIYREGVLSIQKGDDLRIIYEKLTAYLGEKLYKEFSRIRGGEMVSHSYLSYETLRYRVETILNRVYPPPETDPENLYRPPEEMHNRAVERMKREMNPDELLHLYLLVKTPSRKKILRTYSKRSLDTILRLLQENPGYYRGFQIDPLIQKWSTIIKKLEDRGEVNTSRREKDVL